MKSLRPSLISISLVASLAIAGCGNSIETEAADDATTTAAEPAEASTTAAPSPPSEPTETTADATTAAPETTIPPTTAPAASPLAGYEEYAVLQSTIANLDSLSPVIETDNPGTRVILYADAGGRKVYKSIYVKANNRLKIIDLNGGGPPLYNDTI